MSGFFICEILSYLQLNLGTMKKITIFLSMCLLALVSCSGDDSQPAATGNGTRLVKIVSNLPNEGQYISTFHYNGIFLSHVIHSTGLRNVYSYTGMLITRSDVYNSANVLVKAQSYEYDDQERVVLCKSLNLVNSTGYKVVLTYDADGNAVVVEKFTGDLVNQDTPFDNKISKYFFEGELTVRKEITNLNTSEVTNYDLAYDVKNFSFKNIPGYSKILLAGASNAQTTQNLVLETEIDEDSSARTYSHTYTYNAMNYPLTSVFKDDSSGEVWGMDTFFYE